MDTGRVQRRYSLLQAELEFVRILKKDKSAFKARPAVLTIRYAFRAASTAFKLFDSEYLKTRSVVLTKCRQQAITPPEQGGKKINRQVS